MPGSGLGSMLMFMVLLGFPVLHLGGFSHSADLSYLNMRTLGCISQCEIRNETAVSFYLHFCHYFTLKIDPCISDNLVQREPLERNGNNIRKGLETVTKETPALHFCFQGWVEWHVQNCSTFCHVTNILGFVMMQYRQLSQQGIDCNARLGENCFSFYLGRSGHCLTTFLEASGEFFGFLRAVC